MVRRAVDVVLALPALVLLAPTLAVLMAMVRRGSPGPAIFRQIRIGRDGVPFTMLKLRTMTVAAESGKIRMGGRDDARITRLGRILRASRLDELPQLVNVLRGDMSLVGPRAEVPQFVALYAPAQREVLTVRPGLTGPGQLEYAMRFEELLDGAADPNRVYVEQILGPKLAIDLEYVRTRSFVGDLGIVLRTIRLVADPRRGP
jgi:lipopolysaccharide/colanic/teichoic acid biosynthesis glycosyltransferase